MIAKWYILNELNYSYVHTYHFITADDSSDDDGEVTTEIKISTIVSFVFIICIVAAIIIFVNKRRKNKKYKIKIVRVIKA